eukprot:gene6760-2637_t
MAPMKLHYFGLTARAETSRLIMDICHTPGDALMDAKALNPYGQLPVLETDTGKVVTQSAVIDRYLAKKANLLPVGDKVSVKQAESLMELFGSDILGLILKTFKITDKEEQIKTRQELLAGKLGEKLKKLSDLVVSLSKWVGVGVGDKEEQSKTRQELLAEKLGEKLKKLSDLVEECSRDGFVCGGQLSYVDLYLYSWLSTISSGWLDGFNGEMLNTFPPLQRLRYSVASVPAVKAYYAAAEGVRLAYKPEAVADFAPTPPALVLHYWGIAGKGEPTRLIFKVAGIPFEDPCYAFSDAKGHEVKLKGHGQLPLLENKTTGENISQSLTIERYAADMAGLLPVGSDEEVALAESLHLFVGEDIWDNTVAPTMSIQGKDEQIAARKELITGKLGDKLKLLADLLDKHLKDGFVCGGKLCFVDLFLFNWLCFLSCGFVDGIPTDVLDAYPTLQKFRHTIASIPEVEANYADVTEGSMMAYKPEAVSAFA